MRGYGGKKRACRYPKDTRRREMVRDVLYLQVLYLFCQKKLYGDIDALIEELKTSGVQEIHYIPDVEKLGFVPGFVQTPWMIYGIGLIYGKK